jgi:hypothetical protein
MRPYMLLLSLVSSVVACSSEPATVQLRWLVSGPKPGEAGTLLQLTGPDHQISQIALSANYLYLAVPWAGVYRMPKYGGEVVPLQEDANALFRHVATDGDRVFWDYVTFNDSGRPHTQVRGQASGGGTTTTIAEGDFGIADSSEAPWFQAGGGYVYWVAAPESPGSPGAALERVSGAGGPRETLLTFAEPIELPVWVADDTGIFFTTQSGSETCDVHEYLAPGIGSAGQGAAHLAFCPTSDSRAAGTDADLIYLKSQHALWQVSKWDRNIPVTAMVTLSNDAFFYNVAFDESNVYANVLSDTSSSPGWSWVSFPKAGGAMTPFADASLCPNIGSSSATAVDVEYVYLLCGTYDRVVVAPKPAP